MDKNVGYEIKRAVLFDNGRGFALGENPRAPSPFVTWQFTQESGYRDYYWGRYFNTEQIAAANFNDRMENYIYQFGVKVVQTEAPGLYKYYSTQRPVDLGTFPQSFDNKPDQVVNYDERRPVEGEAFRAWGELTYTKPLTKKEWMLYELLPSSDNPDMRKPPIAEQLKEAGRLAQENRGQPGPKKDAPDRGDR